MENKIYLLKDNDELVLTGKQLQELKEKIINETKLDILKIIENWWFDTETCSGKPHCVVDECDLCCNCYGDLVNKIKKYKNGTGNM